MGKLVFFDIDGTIYSYDHGVVEDTKQAISELRAKGHKAFLCTGRTVPMITSDIMDIGFDGIIAGGGTYVKIGEEVLYRADLEEGEAEKLVELMRKYGISPIPEGHEKLYLERLEKVEGPYRKAHELYMTNIPQNIAYIGEEELCAAKVSGAIMGKTDLPGFAKAIEGDYSIVNHGGKLVEVLPKNHSKAKGITILLEYLGEKKEDTYAFGDSFNDLEMLQYVEYGVAMGNSDPNLFEHVKYRTGDFDKGGVREGLLKFGLLD